MFNFFLNTDNFIFENYKFSDDVILKKINFHILIFNNLYSEVKKLNNFPFFSYFKKLYFLKGQNLYTVP